MKIKYLSILAIFIATFSFAQEETQLPKINTIEFKVLGICDMCKERIENALDLPGIKFAEWNKETDICTVIYKTSKITEIQIHKALAEAGHETSMLKPTREKYNALPNCCKYEEIEKH